MSDVTGQIFRFDGLRKFFSALKELRLQAKATETQTLKTTHEMQFCIFTAKDY